MADKPGCWCDPKKKGGNDPADGKLPLALAALLLLLLLATAAAAAALKTLSKLTLIQWGRE